MILDSTKKKNVRLRITEMNGIDTRSAKVYGRLIFENVECCFPADFANDFINLEIPALSEMNDEFGQPKRLTIEVISEGNYIVPFTDVIEVTNPVKMEAAVVDVKDDDPLIEKKITASVVDNPKPEPVVEKVDPTPDPVKPTFVRKTVLQNFLEI